MTVTVTCSQLAEPFHSYLGGVSMERTTAIPEDLGWTFLVASPATQAMQSATFLEPIWWPIRTGHSAFAKPLQLAMTLRPHYWRLTPGLQKIQTPSTGSAKVMEALSVKPAMAALTPFGPMKSIVPMTTRPPRNCRVTLEVSSSVLSATNREVCQ